MVVQCECACEKQVYLFLVVLATTRELKVGRRSCISLDASRWTTLDGKDLRKHSKKVRPSEKGADMVNGQATTFSMSVFATMLALAGLSKVGVSTNGKIGWESFGHVVNNRVPKKSNGGRSFFGQRQGSKLKMLEVSLASLATDRKGKKGERGNETDKRIRGEE